MPHWACVACTYGGNWCSRTVCQNCHEPATLTQLRSSVRSLCFGPWDGGMVTAQLKAQFKAQGVQIIPRPEGAEQVERRPALELVALGDDAVPDGVGDVGGVDVGVALARRLGAGACAVAAVT